MQARGLVIDGRGSARVNEAMLQMQQAFPQNKIPGIAADPSTAKGAEVFFAQAPAP